MHHPGEIAHLDAIYDLLADANAEAADKATTTRAANAFNAWSTKFRAAADSERKGARRG